MLETAPLPPNSFHEQILWLKNLRRKIHQYQNLLNFDPMVAVAIEADASRLIDKLNSDTADNPSFLAPWAVNEDSFDDGGAMKRIMNFIHHIRSSNGCTPDVARDLGIIDE